VRAEAALRRSHGSQGGAGPSPWLVGAYVFLAASLVAVGALVVLSSLDAGPFASRSGPEPPPTPARPTPGVFTVGRQDQSSENPSPAATPASSPQNAPSLLPPSSAGGSFPIVVPPGSQQPQPAAGPPASGGSPSTEASPATGASPDVATGSGDARVERALASLATDEDKVGQLLLLGWIGTTAEAARPELQELRAGGIVYVQNATTAAEASRINTVLRQIARESGALPPLIAIDHEGGIVQRLEDVPNLGNNWDFGITQPSDALACQRGLDHARVLRDSGFTMNLAPVLDVNNNPANPVIGKRSYGDDPRLVARLGAAYIRGLQGNGMAAVGKHFPGHGNTGVDSHLQLPILTQSVDDLERIELVPFRRAIDEAGIAAIMSAHIVFPALDASGVPGTLSKAVMTGLLRNRLGFQGLAISDDLGAMKAITDNYAPGEAAVRAVQAGVDMIIMSAEYSRQRLAREALVAAVRSGEIPRERLDEAVRHVLTVKARVGLLGDGPSYEATCP
jgi:beta-N-acetylhexosaminidase